MEYIGHGFFIRRGGVSSGEFETLNCSLFSEDKKDNVLTNRRAVVETLGCDSLFSLRQVHSNKVITVETEVDLQKVIKADAFITQASGIALGIMGADCAAILFADGINRVIGAAHGGWQGALSGVIENTLSGMHELGADKKHIMCAIGPAIQQKSYEVGKEFVEKFIGESSIDCEDCFGLGENGQSIYFNLPLYIEHRLRNSGVNSIDRFLEDTYSDEEKFFSYRRSYHRQEKSYGRQVGAIFLKNNLES